MNDYKNRRKIIKELIQECLQSSDSYDEFYGAMLGYELMLAQKNYKNRLAPVLNLVAIDREGIVYVLSKKTIGFSVQELRKKFKTQDPLKIPTLEDILSKIKN